MAKKKGLLDSVGKTLGKLDLGDTVKDVIGNFDLGAPSGA